MRYGQKVRVTSGFYEGMEGTVIKVKEIHYEDNYIIYFVDYFDSGKKLIESDYIPESSLELIK